MNLLKFLGYAAASAVILTSCNRNSKPTSTDPGDISAKTGVEYNTEGGFQVASYEPLAEGPGLKFIEGGRTTLGSTEEDVAMTHDNIERTVTVASFFMDETEVANIHWLEYLTHIRRDSAEEVYTKALPDTTVWQRELSFNDPYEQYYLRYPGFRYYPVVGVSWEQANDYCLWRTAKVNENMAKNGGSTGGGGFKLFGKKKNAAAAEAPAEGGSLSIESGLVLPNYRLPTEAEWEYAALAMIGTQLDQDENQSNKRIYPWDGHQVRNPYGKHQGEYLANFKRGRGDYAGIAGSLNDGAMITEWVYAFPANDFGLYNMAGNVNEWVQDVYRPLSFQDVEDLNPVRRGGGISDPAANYDKAGFQSLIDDEVRVFKGGSWKDVAYWLSPGTRRFMAQDSATATIGFRCAMINTGSNK